MADFDRKALLFDCRGMNLAKPVDRLEPNEYRILFNTRAYGEGRLQGRQGITLVSLSGTTGDPAHSLFSFEDPIPSPTQFPGAFIQRVRLLGSGVALLGARAATNPVAYLPIVNGNTLAAETGFSGDPMTFVVSGSSQSQRPWAFIGDSEKNVKVNSSQTSWSYGVAPPNFFPLIAVGAANPDGPDVGASPNPYIYAFRARTDPLLNTGAKSNLGPPVRIINGLSPSSEPGAPVPPSNIVITAPVAHPDAQVRWLDVFRWGGSLPLWLYVGSMENLVGATVTDTFPDSALANSEQAELNDNQPWLSVDINRQGTGTVTATGPGLGGTFSIASGDVMRAYSATGTDPYYLPGTQVSIGGQLFTFYRSPDNPTDVEILEDPITASHTGSFLIANPEMARQPLPCMWGPFGGGLTGIFIFACGDPLRPGALYWTKGNEPESHPGSNVLEISSSSEPLMNGCIFDGKNFVFSNQRAWGLYPTLGQISDFSAIEIPNSKGLFARYAICVTPLGICFLAKDGIYLTTGGEPVSLTDETLYPLFPQESQGVASSFPVIDGLNGVTFSPPDFTEPNAMRLSYGDGFLYFDYLDTGGTYRTLVYAMEQRQPGWVSRDTYTPEGVCHYFEHFFNPSEPESTWKKVLIGGLDGRVFEFGGSADNEEAIAGQIRTGSYDSGDPRPRKLWGDFELDLDSRCDTLNVQAGFDNYAFLSAVSMTGTNYTGRGRVIGDINAGQGQYGYNLGLDIEWTTTLAQPVLYLWVPTVVPKPELTALRVTDWSDDGYPGPKFVQGFYLRCDTLNVARSIAVLSDGGVIQQTFSVQAANEQELEFSFTTPFITHLLRFWPQDANFWRVLGVRWIWEPCPPLVTTYMTQETTHDLQGYFWHRDALVALVSSAGVNLRCIVNGNPSSPFNYTVASTGGVYLKQYLPLQAMKARAVQYQLTSPAGFRLFLRDCEMRVKPWGLGGPFQIKRPFGETSREYGARI